uniref:Uncharacterized protein n=1 Tax=Haptolina brevifila TaxID=156173 RepID=A0A7S2GIR2_9EUKA|mmetsp:Transcript_37371/g.74674  ORF Transcript_37371/g.74674 Transcript_37371/m.74674 type:complete len:473 (+) Transcript_37371:510-1928(+)
MRSSNPPRCSRADCRAASLSNDPAHAEVMIKGELTQQMRELQKPTKSYHLFVSKSNMGALRFVRWLEKELVRLELNGGREITFTSQSEEIPYCDHFLVYLSEGMWDHHLSRATDLEEQLRKAKDKQVPYLLVHEQRTETYGLEWVSVGSERPSIGRELDAPKLRDALFTHRHSFTDEESRDADERAAQRRTTVVAFEECAPLEGASKRTFTAGEYADLNVGRLHVDSFIKVEDTFFVPDPEEQWGAAEFKDIIKKTPQAIQSLGLYSDIAIPFVDGEHILACVHLFLRALCSTHKSPSARLRATCNRWVNDLVDNCLHCFRPLSTAPPSIMQLGMSSGSEDRFKSWGNPTCSHKEQDAQAHRLNKYSYSKRRQQPRLARATIIPENKRQLNSEGLFYVSEQLRSCRDSRWSVDRRDSRCDASLRHLSPGAKVHFRPLVLTLNSAPRAASTIKKVCDRELGTRVKVGCLTQRG